MGSRRTTYSQPQRMTASADPVEKVLVLVKAVPQPSKTHVETVCCAGITPGRLWRRMFPVRFRQLRGDSQFARWQWVEYRYGAPKDDMRKESRRVFEDTIQAREKMPTRDRPEFLAPLILDGVAAAAARGDSLALVRPAVSRFYWRRRSRADMDEARSAYGRAARQDSFLDQDLATFEPPPYDFRMACRDAAGEHDYRCGDWETTAAFFKLRMSYDEDHVLLHLARTYNEDRAEQGMVLAMGNMKKRPNQWQLLGMLALPDQRQLGLPV